MTWTNNDSVCMAHKAPLCYSPLRWRHNDHAGVSNHQPHGCLLNRLFRRKSKKTSKLRVTGLCAGNSPGTGEFPAQMASYAEYVSIWWRHHAYSFLCVELWLFQGIYFYTASHYNGTLWIANKDKGEIVVGHGNHMWHLEDRIHVYWW